jgi:hypothetical protein
MNMTAEQLSDDLEKALGHELKSVVLYGSAAAGDQTKNFSDVNVLVVVETKAPATLRAMMPTVQRWTKAGHTAPLVFSTSWLRRADDVFPIEFSDLKESRKVLFGADPFAHLTVPKTHLRHQIEYELRGKLLQFVRNYLASNGDRKRVQEGLAKSLSSFAALFRAVLRLTGAPAPASRAELWQAVGKQIPIDVAALETIMRLRDGDKSVLAADPNELCDRFINTMETVIDFVDQYK